MSMGETGINLMVLNENLLTYNKTINENHNLNFIAGFSYQYDQVEYNGGSAQNSPSDKIYYAPDGMPEIGQQIYDYGDGNSYTEMKIPNRSAKLRGNKYSFSSLLLARGCPSGGGGLNRPQERKAAKV